VPERGAVEVARAQALADELLGPGRATFTALHGRWRYAVDDARPLYLPPQSERSLQRRLWVRSWSAAEYALSLDAANALAQRLSDAASLRVNAVHPLPGTPFAQWVVDYELGAGPWTEARLVVAEDEPGLRLWLDWLEEDPKAGAHTALAPSIQAAEQKYAIANR
jgi:hypothetical protein